MTALTDPMTAGAYAYAALRANPDHPRYQSAPYIAPDFGPIEHVRVYKRARRVAALAGQVAL